MLPAIRKDALEARRIPLGYCAADSFVLILIDSNGVVPRTHSGRLDESRFAELAGLIRKTAADIPTVLALPR